MKIKNVELKNLINVYIKLVNAEYDDYELALKLTKDGYVIDEAVKAFDSLKDSMDKKYTDENGHIKEELVEKYQKEFDKLINAEQEVTLNKIPFEVIKTIKIKGFEAKLLDDYGLIDKSE